MYRKYYEVTKTVLNNATKIQIYKYIFFYNIYIYIYKIELYNDNNNNLYNIL